MGKRRFRLGQYRKNEERVQRCLIVSVPRESVSISVSPSLTVTLPPPLACPVSIPLAVISECVVSSLEHLASNLSLLNPFPAYMHWMHWMVHTCVVEIQIIVYFSNGTTMPPHYMVYPVSIVLNDLS